MPARAPQPDWSSMSDEELALHCATEVAGSMDELLRRYERTVRECARRMALDPEQAEDVAQEIFLRVVTSLPRYEGRSAFSTWLYRLAHNTCIDAFRRQARKARHSATLPRAEESDTGDVFDLFPAGEGEPDVELERRIQECYLGWVVSQLPESYQEVIRARLVEGRSSEEVAALLGTTVDSVKARLRRARKRLREELRRPRRCPFCGTLGPVSPEAGGRTAATLSR